MWSFDEWCLWWAMLDSMPEFRCGEKPVAEVEVFRGVSDGKRTDAVMAEVYDAEIAELIADHMAEKCRVRNRRKADRKHKAENWEQEKKNRKDLRCEYVCRDSRRRYGHGKSCYWDSNAERKMNHAERSIRADWELESVEIAEAEEAEAIRKAIIAEYDRIEAERKQRLADMALNEWLKTA